VLIGQRTDEGAESAPERVVVRRLGVGVYARLAAQIEWVVCDQIALVQIGRQDER